MSSLNSTAQGLLSQVANASGVSGLGNKLITIAQESPTFVNELNDFANNNGTFQVLAGTSGFSASFKYSGYSDNALGVINVGLPASAPTTSIVPDVYATGSMPTSGTQDYAATIIGSLAHELGHYEDAFSNPYYTNTSSLSGAGYVANALVSEGVAEQNNLIVQKEIAQNSDGQYVISFLLASDQNTNNNGYYGDSLLNKSSFVNAAGSFGFRPRLLGARVRPCSRSRPANATMVLGATSHPMAPMTRIARIPPNPAPPMSRASHWPIRASTPNRAACRWNRAWR